MTQKIREVAKAPTKNLKTRSLEWPEFQAKLATVLKTMQEDEFLVIRQKRSSLFVQFSAQGSFGIRVETTSNAYLGDAEKHDSETHLALLALGWKPPTGDAEESTPINDPDGSPNYFVEYPATTATEQIARFAVRTLADLYDIAHPANLEYEAFDEDGTPIEHKTLKIQSVRDRKARSTDPAKRLLKAVIDATGIEDLEYDEDHHLCLRFGELGIFVMLTEDAESVRILSPVATEVICSDALLAEINTLNAENKALRFFFHDDSVMAMYIIPAQPIVDRHIRKALWDFGRQTRDASSKLATVLLNTRESGQAIAQTLH